MDNPKNLMWVQKNTLQIIWYNFIGFITNQCGQSHLCIYEGLCIWKFSKTKGHRTLLIWRNLAFLPVYKNCNPLSWLLPSWSLGSYKFQHLLLLDLDFLFPSPVNDIQVANLPILHQNKITQPEKLAVRDIFIRLIDLYTEKF